MRAWIIGLLLGAMLASSPARAYDAEDPANCNGAEQDEALTILVSRVSATPRVNFVKSPYDDDFTAASCPAATDACRKASYLVTGDLVMVGRTRGAFSCVTYQSPSGKKPVWTTGWLPSSALTPAAPQATPKITDWTGAWETPCATINIKRGGTGGKLKIDGLIAVKGARDVHTGTMNAQVSPEKDNIAFLEDGSQPFATDSESGCRVRMQRFGAWLVVVDNGQCGGAGISFNGFYHRN